MCWDFVSFFLFFFFKFFLRKRSLFNVKITGANNFIGINIFLWFFDLPSQANNLKIIVPYLLALRDYMTCWNIQLSFAVAVPKFAAGIPRLSSCFTTCVFMCCRKFFITLTSYADSDTRSISLYLLISYADTRLFSHCKGDQTSNLLLLVIIEFLTQIVLIPLQFLGPSLPPFCFLPSPFSGMVWILNILKANIGLTRSRGTYLSSFVLKFSNVQLSGLTTMGERA